ncbi:hypothetical protein PYCH_16520 [Pyrococcus yayanosii CH1]|uniref:polynucleotide 5'-hydroxyl-kinase n=2 Tax=Pyrococcus TaxID=2260 RepID=F8AH87_PYRYC|nr:hypothetical protein PYCH_16520 [Pyrococcus yayanosii CH1]
MNKASLTQDVPPDRVEAMEKIIERPKPVKVMILGGVDTGKTTLTVYLANALVEQGLKVAIIDSDVGQKGILPPATISLALAEAPFSSLGELSPLKHYFVGTVTPNQHFAEMVVGVTRLARLAQEVADVVLIDTTGLVHGPGVELKRMKIEAVGPDIVLALDREGELAPILKPFEGKLDVVKLQVSDKARSYSRGERRDMRREKWRAYFRGVRPITLDLSKFVITGTSLFQGRPLSEEEKGLLEGIFKWLILHGRKVGGRYFIVKADVGEGPRSVDRNVLRYIDFDRLSNILLGLIDEDGFCLGLGILKLLNFGDMKAEILTPLDDGELARVKEIRFGRMRVREDGEELGLLDRDAL